MRNKLLALIAGLALSPSLSFGQTDAAEFLTDRYGQFGVQYLSETFIRAAANYIDSTGTISSIGTDLREAILFFEPMSADEMKKLSAEILAVSKDRDYEELGSYSDGSQRSVLYGEFDDEECEAIQLHLYSQSSGQFIFAEIVGSVNIMEVISMVQNGDALDMGQQLDDITNLLNLDLD